MYNSINDVLRREFGCKIYKLALSGGMSCPNRDGTIGTRGCIFCSEKGSGEFASPACKSIDAQIEEAKRITGNKAKNAKYIAYFQSFTNTYAPAEKLRELFTPAINHLDVVALSVATRPDCLPDDVMALLSELVEIKPVWVELGLQTMHDRTADYIRRGYGLPCFESAVARLRKAGVKVIVHMIIGLPGETPRMMFETASYIGRSGAQGVKLQLLHVLSGTDLAAEYGKGAFEVLSLSDYIGILEECVRLLPPEMEIHRLTGDGAKADLIAPLWSADKKNVLNRIKAAFEADGIVQGERFNSFGGH
jgi:radical SAM protein (TIGR01212 family)